ALFLMTLNAHFFMLVGLVFLTVLYFATMMMIGRHPPMVYQFSASAALSLIVGALTTQEPSYAALTRLALTFVGTAVAALMTATLESMANAWERPTLRR
ncbi:FUSC family protein, partial [Agrobacterium tumefaciens]